MLLFIWIALVYVIVAFADVTASTFVTGDEDLEGLDVRRSTRAARSRWPRVLYLGARGGDGRWSSASSSRRCGC